MKPVAPRDVRGMALERVGQTLNQKWTLDRLIDVGGMAAVYAATHRNGKRVAIKILHPFVAAKGDSVERFRREGYVANQVEHPGAVSILDDDVGPDGAPFLVMELLEGESLEGWMTRVGGTLSVADCLAVADQVLDVLSAFHARGVVHRDIKPANLFVTSAGVVKVLDFGLARLRDPRVATAPTAMGVILGTAAYMPPEQAQGKVDLVDARSDVFGVGAVMFRALTGRAIHQAESPMQRVVQAMKDRAPSLGEVVPEMSPWVVGIVDKALAFERDDRWPSAAEMRAAVRTTFSSLRDQAARAKVAPAKPERDDVSVALDAMFETPSIVVDVSFTTLDGDTANEAPDPQTKG